MNPMLVDALGSILRWGLMILASELVHHGIWTSTDAERYVGAFSMFLLTLGWSLWARYRARQVLVTALSAAKMTESQAKSEVVSAMPTPTVTTPADTIPGVPKG